MNFTVTCIRTHALVLELSYQPLKSPKFVYAGSSVESFTVLASQSARHTGFDFTPPPPPQSGLRPVMTVFAVCDGAARVIPLGIEDYVIRDIESGKKVMPPFTDAINHN